jgi:predicted GIY-YIG superfamily endonuclease
LTGESGLIYIIHFERPLSHSSHYVGWTAVDKFDKRMARHRRGAGAKILRAATAAGIGWRVTNVLSGTRDDERALKNQHHTKRYCPNCSGHIKETPTNADASR